MEKFISPFPDPEAYGIDALSMDWANLNVYAFPPFAKVGRVVKKFEQTENCRMILIAPYWPVRSWCATLMQLSRAAPWEIPKRWDLPKQPLQEIYHNNFWLLNLHA